MDYRKIERLLSERNDACLSVIISTHRSAPERLNDKISVENVIQRTTEIISTNVSIAAPDREKLLSQLGTMLANFDFNHSREGLGIYLTPTHAALISYPFPVQEKIMLGSRFACKELLQYQQTPIYYVLVLHRKSIRLFKGEGMELQELINTDFPSQYEEEYEYAPSSIASGSSFSPKGFEKDKTTLQRIRFRDFLRKTEKKLSAYLTASDPIILVGGAKEIADHAQTNVIQSPIIGTVKTGLDPDQPAFSEKLWELVRNYQHLLHTAKINELKELGGKGLLVYGIDAVRHFLEETGGQTLLLEEDFESYALAPNAVDQFYSEKAGPLTSLTEKILTTALSKSDKILFTASGSLRDFKRIALILHYKPSSG